MIDPLTRKGRWSTISPTAGRRNDPAGPTPKEGIHIDPLADPRPVGAHKIAAALAYDWCRQHGFGGRERSLHTVEYPELIGTEVAIEKTRHVRTGTYKPTVGRSTMDGWDTDPAYLSNMKSHRLLDLLINEAGHGGQLTIEAANVELIA